MRYLSKVMFTLYYVVFSRPTLKAIRYSRSGSRPSDRGRMAAGVGGHQHPEIMAGGGGVNPQISFLPFGPQFDLTFRGRGLGGPGPSFGSATVSYEHLSYM